MSENKSPLLTGADMMLTVIAISDQQHPPVKMQFYIPEELANLLMSQPLLSVSLGVSLAHGVVVDKSKFVDFK